MKGFLIVGLLGFGTLASAANLSIDFTQIPTAFNQDANWDTFGSTATTFSGTFLAVTAETGSENIAIVDENTGLLLDTLALTFSSGGNDGTIAEETFGGSVVAGIDSGTAPGGFISELATGSPVDFTADLAGAGPFPTNITIQETENSPSAAVPEPASFALLGLGVAGLALIRRYVKKAA